MVEFTKELEFCAGSLCNYLTKGTFCRGYHQSLSGLEHCRGPQKQVSGSSVVCSRIRKLPSIRDSKRDCLDYRHWTYQNLQKQQVRGFHWKRHLGFFVEQKQRQLVIVRAAQGYQGALYKDLGRSGPAAVANSLGEYASASHFSTSIPASSSAGSEADLESEAHQRTVAAGSNSNGDNRKGSDTEEGPDPIRRLWYKLHPVVMHGIHGLDSVRRGDFDHVVDRSVKGPAARQLPMPARQAQDLAFAVSSTPYSLWIQGEGENIRVSHSSSQTNKETALAPQLGNEGSEPDSTSSVLIERWIQHAREKSGPWIAQVLQSPEEQAKLDNFLHDRKGSKGRLVLGTYFGLLIEYWLLNCKELGIDRLESSIVVHGRTAVLGSLKFVWLFQEHIMHMECSIKFFCWTGHHLVGPHLSETLLTRFRFAERKIAVAHAASKTLRKEFNSESKVLSLATIQGYVFYDIDEFVAAKGHPRLPPSENETPHTNASICERHIDHLLPNHLKRWYSRDFASASLKLSKADREERWTILPKLYWLAPLRIPSSETEKYGLPLLKREDMANIVQTHHDERGVDDLSQVVDDPGNMSRRQMRRAEQCGHLNGPSPLMMAQLSYSDATNTWEEVSRGFLLGHNWSPASLLASESTGDGVPNEPSTFLVEEDEPVSCRFQGSENSAELDFEKQKTTKKIVKPNKRSVCAFCKNLDVAPAIEAILDRGDASQLIKELFKVDDGGHVVQLKTNDHARHVVQEVCNSLLSLDAEPCVNADFALYAAIAVSQLADHNMDIQAREHKTFCRLALRASTLAVDSLHDEDEESKQPSHRAVTDFFKFCVARRDMELLHLMLFSGRSLDKRTNYVIDEEATDLVEAYIRDRLLGDEFGEDLTNVEAAAAVGLMRVVYSRFTDSDLGRMLAQLVRMRHYEAAETLIDIVDAPAEIMNAFYRGLLTEGRNYKRAMAFRRAHPNVKETYPAFDHHELRNKYRESDTYPLLASNVKWVSEPSEAKAPYNMSLVFVDDTSTLTLANKLLDDALAESPYDKIVVGVDAEWGEQQLKKHEREALDGGLNTEEDNIVAASTPPYLALWQVSIDDKHILLIDLETLLSDPLSDVGQQALAFLLKIIDSNKVIMTGFSLHEDFWRLRAMLQPVLSKQETSHLTMNIVDSLSVIAAFFPEKSRDLLGDPLCISLDMWSRLLLNARLDKVYQCSEWSARPLQPEQLQYAALDALTPVRLVRAVLGGKADSPEFQKWAQHIRLW